MNRRRHHHDLNPHLDPYADPGAVGSSPQRARDRVGVHQLLRLRELGFERHATAGRAGFERRIQTRMGEWAEQDFLQHCSAQYANLQRNPRSTIAAAFSCNGAVISSTHGDHTVKIVSCETGETLTVLDGHQRTPWVVRFNPVKPEVVASGSLDHSVMVWDSSSGQRLLHHNFGKPIASVAFHSQGDIMAVASGHKVYSWVYNQVGNDVSAPAIILKTRKSLRALHFHPLGCPVMLTAEVVERKSSSSTAGAVAAATAALAEQPALDALDAAVTAAVQLAGTAAVAAAAAGTAAASAVTVTPGAAGAPPQRLLGPAAGLAAVAGTGSAGAAGQATAGDGAPSSAHMSVLVQLAAYIEAANRATSTREHGAWMRLLLQQRRALQPIAHPALQLPESDTSLSLANMTRMLQAQPLGVVDLVAAAAASRQQAGWRQRCGRRQRSGQAVTMPLESQMDAAWEGVAASLSNRLPNLERLSVGTPGDEISDGSSGASISLDDHVQHQQGTSSESVTGPLIPLVPPTVLDQPVSKVFDLSWGWEVSPTASAEALQSLREQRSVLLHRQLPMPTLPEQPCIVNLILWPFSAKNPEKPLIAPLLQLPRTVLCSEMGTCFSRCGRYLAVCVATDTPSTACATWMDIHAPRNQAPRRCRQSSAAKGTSSGVPPANRPTTALNASNQAGSASTALRGISGPARTPAGGARTASRMAAPFSPPPELQFSMDLDGDAATGIGAPSATPPAGMAAAWPPQTPKTPATADAAAAGRAPLYELRVYSLDGPTFGAILYARPVRAAHCLTSIQFSPTSKHLLVAYGRRHVSLCSLLLGEGQLTPVHTVVEIYKVSDMRLVRQLAVLEDEVNVAAWHPYAGGGLLYGTKEGKLRLFKHDRRDPARTCIPVLPRARPLEADDELWEAERNAGRDSHSDDDN